MMHRFFLSSNMFWLLMGLTVFFALFASGGFFTLWFFSIAIVLVIFRRKKLVYKDQFRNENSTYLAPVNGFVFDIIPDVEYMDKKFNVIRFNMPHFYEWGVYLPQDGEVEEVSKLSGKQVLRYITNLPNLLEEKFNHVNIVTKSRNDNLCILKVVRCVIGWKPKIWLVPGDRGRGGACCGFLPFGGTVLMYVPANFDIVINKHDKVVAGETLIAGFNQD